MTRRPATASVATRAVTFAAATAAAFTISHAHAHGPALAPAAATTSAGTSTTTSTTTSAAAPERFDFDRTPGRLSKDSRPLKYRLQFDLDPAQDSFGGSAEIDIELRRGMPSVLLHAARLQAGDASVQGADGRRRALRIEADAAAATWRLVPADGRALAPGRHTLHLAWRGLVQRSGEGLYRVDTNANGGSAGAGPMLFTQLQAVYARNVFPSFDEPAFRAVFEIAVRAPRGLQVESNMPSRTRVDEGGAAGTATLHRFVPTPSMPSYLVALAVGRFDTLEGRAGAVPLRILTAPGKRAQAAYAMGVTQQLLPYYSRYFGLPYALPKLDQLAVPGVRNGAMEDWGLISYNEGLLLVDRERSGPDTQRWVFSLAAHEIAHQWFGNLVTAASWDEIWLNEAFATWMENKATDHFNPEWQLPLDVRRHLDRAMARDASTATRAIRGGMVDESRVSSQFDNITYNKGGAVLSMLEQWLGPEVFRRGLAAYMRERRYSNAAAGDLWHHLARASGRDVAAVATSWTDQPGVPVVSVAQDCRGGRTVMRLSQRRFAVEPGLTPQRWRIPVQLRQDLRHDMRQDARQRTLKGTDRVRHRGKQQATQQATLLLDAAEAEHTLGACSHEPVLANAGGLGYYRVKYAAEVQPALAAAFPTLSPADRMMLLSDGFALAQAGEQPLAGYLALLKQLPAAQDPGRAALFAQAGDALSFLDDAFAGLPAQARVHEAARALFSPELKRLGWDPRPGEPATDARQRVRLIQLLARFDDAEVIAEARARFETDAAGRTPLPPSLRPGVVAAVGRHATGAEFARLRSQLLAAGSEEDRWLLASALAAAGTAEQVDAVLALSLAGQLPPNIASELPGMVADAGRFGERAYEFTKQNFEALAKLAGIGPFGGSRWLLPNAAQAFHDGAHATALLEDQRRLAGDAGAAEAGRVAARIRLHAAVREREAQHMLAAAR
jgi:aminopeptidase N